jgi:hypothetical protein
MKMWEISDKQKNELKRLFVAKKMNKKSDINFDILFSTELEESEIYLLTEKLNESFEDFLELFYIVEVFLN